MPSQPIFYPQPLSPLDVEVYNASLEIKKPVGYLGLPGTRTLIAVIQVSPKRYLANRPPSSMLILSKLYGIEIQDIRTEGDLAWLYKGASPQRWD